MKKHLLLLSLATAVVAGACSTYKDDGGLKEGYPYDSSGGNGGNGQAGVVTAGEWNDLDNWSFWAGLVKGQDFGDKPQYWNWFTDNLVAVKTVNASGSPVAGVKVSLESNGKVVWSALTDNLGQANLWYGLFTSSSAPIDASVTLKVGDTEQSYRVTTLSSEQIDWNTYTVVAPSVQNAADIAFMVDATGSMCDEIEFLKEDLVDIINKVSTSQSSTAIRTGALFYRDEGDEYLTRTSDFTSELNNTVQFIKKQEGNGGGDYPEAVHTALAQGLQTLSWNTEAKSRILFIILDAPPHHTTEIINSIQSSIKTYAKMGIKIIPVAASGVDKNTEFLLRDFAITTGGTYVFITNDSGVGGDHIAPSVGKYTVELLNDLMVRLIKKYIQ